MPAIRHQGHRTIDRAADDFGDHHHRRQSDHKPGAALIAVMMLAEKLMRVTPAIEGMGVHADRLC
jgi:hypothetical protein